MRSGEGLAGAIKRDGVGVGEASGFLVLDLSLGAVDDFGGMNEIIKCRSRTPTWWGRSSRSGRIVLELVWKCDGCKLITTHTRVHHNDRV